MDTFEVSFVEILALFTTVILATFIGGILTLQFNPRFLNSNIQHPKSQQNPKPDSYLHSLSHVIQPSIPPPPPSIPPNISLNQQQYRYPHYSQQIQQTHQIQQNPNILYNQQQPPQPIQLPSRPILYDYPYPIGGETYGASAVRLDSCLNCGNRLWSNFLMIPSAINNDHYYNYSNNSGFEWKKLYQYSNGKQKKQIPYDDAIAHYKFDSITEYLTSNTGRNSKEQFIEFNNKGHRNNNYISNPLNNHGKYRGNMVTSSLNKAVSSFPFLIAEKQENRFKYHKQLKTYMNLYQKNDTRNDIYYRKMSDKQNINKKWNVLGLIDPDKNLSTLDHSLNIHLVNSQLQRNYDYDRYAFERMSNDLLNTEIVNYHHWIPTVFFVNYDLTKCDLLSEIPNLDPYKYSQTLYPLIKSLFLYQITQFENVANYNLRGRPLKVVVKSQDYQLFNCVNNNDSYFGNIHKEGLYEDIICVALYYYHIDDGINGGELELSSIISLKKNDNYSGGTTLKNIKINISEGTSLVFSNDYCYHRVLKLNGNGSRKIIAFFLLRPKETFQHQIQIDARFVVVNWKYHTKHLVLKWLKISNAIDNINGYSEWILPIIYEYVVGNKKYIENATELYDKCRRGYVDQITSSESSLTSNGVRKIHMSHVNTMRVD